MTAPRSGRAAIEYALRGPLAGAGWSPRASGWFTMVARPGFDAVLAVSTASRHAAAGEAQATVHVGLRVDHIERQVAGLLAVPDEGYRSRTITVPIGEIISNGSWTEWLVTPSNAGDVADEIATTVESQVRPYLLRLASEPERQIEGIRRSASWSQTTGRTRLVVASAANDQVDDALVALAEWNSELGDRSDLAAHHGREAIAVLQAWLAPAADSL